VDSARLTLLKIFILLFTFYFAPVAWPRAHLTRFGQLSCGTICTVCTLIALEPFACGQAQYRHSFNLGDSYEHDMVQYNPYHTYLPSRQAGRQARVLEWVDVGCTQSNAMPNRAVCLEPDTSRIIFEHGIGSQRSRLIPPPPEGDPLFFFSFLFSGRAPYGAALVGTIWHVTLCLLRTVPPFLHSPIGCQDIRFRDLLLYGRFLPSPKHAWVHPQKRPRAADMGLGIRADQSDDDEYGDEPRRLDLLLVCFLLLTLFLFCS